MVMITTSDPPPQPYTLTDPAAPYCTCPISIRPLAVLVDCRGAACRECGRPVTSASYELWGVPVADLDPR